MNHTSWGEIEALVLAAARRQPEGRVRLVESVRPLEPVRPVERADVEVLRHTLGSLVTQTSDGVLTWPAHAISLQPGEQVGPYAVLHRLGRGGMGEVFLARDSRLDRQVALKYLLPSDQAPSQVQERIIREARLAARITHPNVATVHDVIDHEGRTFIVMEYVEGESLSAVLRRETIAEARLVQIARQLTAALMAAHRVGIIHRDLKPSNIQVTPHGSVKVLDFGIATAYAAIAAATTAGVTAHVEALTVPAGTLGYMAPEQLLGRPVDERSDIFSLSTVLYEMATGRAAFDVRDPLDNLVAIIRGAPRVDGTGRQVTERTADIIARGLESDPAKRYQSAAEMEAALEALPTAAGDSTTPWRRYLTVAAGAALVPLAVWALGWMMCAVYNNTFGRTGMFAAETPVGYFIWGIKSLVAPSVYAVLALLSYWAIAFIFKVVVSLLPPASRWQTSARVRLRTLADRFALNDPVNLAQGLASAGLAALFLIVWWFSPLIRAWAAWASTDDITTLKPLGPDGEKLVYRLLLTLLLVVFSAGLFRVLQLRRRLAMRRGKGSIAALTMIVLGFVLLNEVPYRIMWGRSVRVEYQTSRCYITGESAVEYLLYCPAVTAPRNKVVRKDDPGVQRTTFYENVFTSQP